MVEAVQRIGPLAGEGGVVGPAVVALPVDVLAQEMTVVDVFELAVCLFGVADVGVGDDRDAVAGGLGGEGAEAEGRVRSPVQGQVAGRDVRFAGDLPVASRLAGAAGDGSGREIRPVGEVLLGLEFAEGQGGVAIESHVVEGEPSCGSGCAVPIGGAEAQGCDVVPALGFAAGLPVGEGEDKLLPARPVHGEAGAVVVPAIAAGLERGEIGGAFSPVDMPRRCGTFAEVAEERGLGRRKIAVGDGAGHGGQLGAGQVECGEELLVGEQRPGARGIVEKTEVVDVQIRLRIRGVAPAGGGEGDAVDLIPAAGAARAALATADGKGEPAPTREIEADPEPPVVHALGRGVLAVRQEHAAGLGGLGVVQPEAEDMVAGPVVRHVVETERGMRHVVPPAHAGPADLAESRRQFERLDALRVLATPEHQVGRRAGQGETGEQGANGGQAHGRLRG